MFVQNPALRPRSASESIPHLYRDGSLCLFYPPGEEWHPSRHVSRTTIPWTVLWLVYYETWHATGTWFGGGLHPR